MRRGEVSLFGREYRGCNPLCMGTGNAISLCRSRLPQNSQVWRLRRCCTFGAISQRLEGKELKLTRHNGRAGKNGTYNPKHNDRRFDIANSEHIDEERAKQNLYWDCYNGFRNFKNPEKENELSATFEDV